MLCHRIPLVKKKSLRQNLIENGKLKEFMRTHKYNLGSKYIREAATLVSDQPLQNYLDVSVWAGSCWHTAVGGWHLMDQDCMGGQRGGDGAGKGREVG